MLGADREANRAGIDVLFLKFIRCELRVGCRSRMDHETLDIGNVCQQREDLKGVDKASGTFAATVDLDGEY